MDSKSRNRLLGVLFFGVLMGALDIAIVGPALKPIGAHFGVDSRSLQWVFTIYVLMNLVATPLMAKLSDRVGRRPIYLLDVAFFAIGSLVAGLAPSFGVLVAGRALQGFGAGGIFPVATAVIGDTFPVEKRGGALGMIGAVWGFAFIIGPLLGMLLLGFGWQWIFFVNPPVALLVMAASLKVMPATGRSGHVVFDWGGMAMLALMLGSLALGLSQIDSSHLASSLVSASVLPFLVLALVLVPVFWIIELRAADPVVRPGLLRRKQLLLTDLLSLGTGLGEASLVFIPSLAAVLLGMSAQSSSAMLLPVVLTMSVGTPMVGRLLDKIGSRLIIMSGGVLLAAGMLLMKVMTADLLPFIVSGVLIGAGLSSLLGAPMRYIVLNEASPSERGAAQAVLSVFTSIGQLIGGTMVGAVASSYGGGAEGFTTAYAVIGVIALGLTFGGLFLKGRAEEMAETGAPQALHPERSAGS